MSRRGSGAIPIDRIAEMLGSVRTPGSLEAFAAALQQPTGNVMRLRRDTPVDQLTIPTTSVPWYSLGRRPTSDSPRPSRTLQYAAADYFVQDAGSLLALATAEADSNALDGLLVCDLCAAPGGKASALVEAIDAGYGRTNAGFVLANEVIRSRLGALQLNLARTGSDRYAVSSMDPDSLADRLPGLFDVVVVDAPCSGQALLSRGKQKSSSFSVSQIQHSASRQQRILDAAVRLLRDGGRLIYSTCTFAEAENEMQIARLQDDAVATPIEVKGLEPYRSSAIGYRLWPHQHQCAGSFAAAAMINQSSSSEERRRRSKSTLKSPVDLAQWYGDSRDSIRLQQLDSVLIGWPDDAPSWVDDVATSGPELAHRTGQTWKPAHAAALRRVSRARASLTTDLDVEDSLRFLRGETVPNVSDGWQVARCLGRPLGWIKGTRGVGKNHLPTAARISGDLSVQPSTNRSAEPPNGAGKS